MLTPFQTEVRRIIGRLGNDHGFALAGGAALIAYGIVDRATRDLDFLGPSGVVVDSFVEQVERHLASLSFRTQRLTEYPQLVRMRIEFEGDELMIDIGVDYRSFPPVATPDGLLLDQLDLAGDGGNCLRRHTVSPRWHTGPMIETHHYQPVDERTDEDNANVLSLSQRALSHPQPASSARARPHAPPRRVQDPMKESTRNALASQWHRLNNVPNDGDRPNWPAIIDCSVDLTEMIDDYLRHEDGTVEDVAAVFGVPAEHVDEFINPR